MEKLTQEEIIELFKKITSELSLCSAETIEKVLSQALIDNSGAFANNHSSNEVGQRNLQASWLLLKQAGHIYQDFDDIGFRVFSQNNEDGILLYLFTILGTGSKMAVEIGANCGDSKIGFPQCNSANLVVNHGWNSLILDGSNLHISQLTHFFARSLNTKHFHWTDRKSLKPEESYYYVPLLRQSMIDAENVNDLIVAENISGEIDLLSIDVDGMDYWIWNAINVISPRVIVIEYNKRISPELAVTVPYKSDYVVDLNKKDIWNYNGASLLALEKLGKKKGYSLVGTDNNRINAFFVRNDLINGLFNPIDISTLYNDQKCLSLQPEDYFKKIHDLMQSV
jgi:hypothetical protein